MFSPYIKEEWKDSIKSYIYKSTDESIYYKNVTNPLCNWLIKFVPKTIA